LQSAQIPMLTIGLPHAVPMVPAAHVPVIMPIGMLQQPVWQGAIAEQLKLQLFAIALQPVLLAGQSGLTLQPHVPPPIAATHTWPAFIPMNCATQLTHTPPLLPHTTCVVPATHVPVVIPIGMLQQPVLHGVF